MPDTDYEWGQTPHGDKYHIVQQTKNTALLIGGRASGMYGDADRQALCGLVADYDTDVDDPDYDGDICLDCRRKAGQLAIQPEGVA